MIDFENRPLASGLLVLFGGALLAFVLGAFIWGLRTNFSYWWGQQGAIQEKNSTSNWVAAQQAFHQDKNDVDGDVQKIRMATADLAAFNQAHPDLLSESGLVGMQDTQTWRDLLSNQTGLKQQCVTTVTDYNTKAKSFLTEDWRDADLPPSLDASVCG